MASTTANLGLTKPASGEAYNIDVFNQNFQKIDNEHGINARSLTAASGITKGASCRLTRIGAVCTLALDVILESAQTIGSTYVDIATFSMEDAPSGDIFAMCYQYNANNIFVMNIYTNKVTVRALGTSGIQLPANTRLRGTVTWIAGG